MSQNILVNDITLVHVRTKDYFLDELLNSNWICLCMKMLDVDKLNYKESDWLESFRSCIALN